MKKAKTYRVLLEAGKLMEADGDGIKRYLIELLRAFDRVLEESPVSWEIDLFIYGDIVPLHAYRPYLDIRIAQHRFGLMAYEKPLLRFKKWLGNTLPTGSYKRLAALYRGLPFRPLLQLIKKGSKAVQRSLKPLYKDPRLAGYDLIHLPLPQHEDSFERLGIPTLITVHDLTHKRFPEFHQARNIRLAEKGFRFARKTGARFIAVSEATRQDLLNYLGIAEDRVRVIAEAADKTVFRVIHDPQRMADLRARYGIGAGPYLLTVSTIEPRKNLKRMIEAFIRMKEKDAHPGLQLVIAGKPGWKSREVPGRAAKQHSDIIYTGFIDESDLPALYSGALALCYFSIYEGFGLPALEAMQCGTPVLYGQAGALPALVGDAGLPADPLKIDEMAAAMQLIASDEKLRERLSEAARKRAALFDWDEAGRQTLACYADCIEKNSSSCE